MVAAASAEPSDDEELVSVGALSADDVLELEVSLLEAAESEDDAPMARLLKFVKLFSPVSALCGYRVSIWSRFKRIGGYALRVNGEHHAVLTVLSLAAVSPDRLGVVHSDRKHRELRRVLSDWHIAGVEARRIRLGLADWQARIVKG